VCDVIIQERWITKARCKILKKQKNGGHLKRGGTLQCPPVRSSRPRTLRTVTG
jgi:hypothetical protein